MAIEIKKDGVVIRRSKNLRGIIDHARRVGVFSACVRRRLTGTPGLIYVHFSDGSEAYANFESYSVAVDFVLNRRSWGLMTTEQSETARYFYQRPAPC